jgi:inorganic pyrophosphatase
MIVFWYAERMLYHFDPDPGPESPRVLRMVVEIPKNSSNKYEFDHTLGVFKLSRTLYSPIHYPGDYGFVPGTIAEDGDPLDILAMVSSPSFSGCLSYVRPVGVLDMIDGGEVDHKILAMSLRDPRHDQVKSFDDVFPHIKREIEHFFSIYKELESKPMPMGKWRGLEAACEVIVESRKRYLASVETSSHEK